MAIVRAVKNNRPSAPRGSRKLPPIEGLTIQELASQAGITTRAARHYFESRVLESPLLHGRRTRYGRDHLARVVAIVALRNTGLDLAAIRVRLSLIPSLESGLSTKFLPITGKTSPGNPLTSSHPPARTRPVPRSVPAIHRQDPAG